MGTASEGVVAPYNLAGWAHGKRLCTYTRSGLSGESNWRGRTINLWWGKFSSPSVRVLRGFLPECRWYSEKAYILVNKVYRNSAHTGVLVVEQSNIHHINLNTLFVPQESQFHGGKKKRTEEKKIIIPPSSKSSSMGSIFSLVFSFFSFFRRRWRRGFEIEMKRKKEEKKTKQNTQDILTSNPWQHQSSVGAQKTENITARDHKSFRKRYIYIRPHAKDGKGGEGVCYRNCIPSHLETDGIRPLQPTPDSRGDT